MSDTNSLEIGIIEPASMLAEYQKTKLPGGSAMLTFQSVLADEIIIPLSAADATDPNAMVKAAIKFAEVMQEQAFFLPGEYAQEAAWCYYVNDYLSQASQGGHVQYFANRGADDLALKCCGMGLKSMLADPHLSLFELFLKLKTGSPKAALNAARKAGYKNAAAASRDLDSRFAKIEQEESMAVRQKTWLKSLRKLRVVPDAEVHQQMSRLAELNPLRETRRRESARLRADNSSTDPAHVAARQLCQQAGLLFVGVSSTGFVPMRSVWPEGPAQRAFGWRVDTNLGPRQALFYSEGFPFTRRLAVLISDGEALPVGSLSLSKTEFDAVVPKFTK